MIGLPEFYAHCSLGLALSRLPLPLLLMLMKFSGIVSYTNQYMQVQVI